MVSGFVYIGKTAKTCPWSWSTTPILNSPKFRDVFLNQGKGTVVRSKFSGESEANSRTRGSDAFVGAGGRSGDHVLHRVEVVAHH